MAFVEDLPASLHARTPEIGRARWELAVWLADHGGRRTALADLMGDLGMRLIEADVPVSRIAVALRDYHPEFVGRQYNWRQGRGVEQVDRRYVQVVNEVYAQSPIRVIADGAAALRRRLTGKAAQIDFPVLKELAADGVTDYVALPLLFSDGSRQFVAFASNAEPGFRADQLAYLETLLPQLRQRIEVEYARQLADRVLEVYLGSYAAPRVLGGEVRRVRGQAIRAIVLASDLRGFTHLADSHDADTVFAALSAFYDAVAEPVLGAGGDIVKMIADGILAVFPLPEAADAAADCAIACGALRAVQAAHERLSGLGPQVLPDGVEALRAGFALHAGEVTFGNVGSRARLDFTLIGPAVNEAFRIEAMTKTLGQPILMSAAFAALAGDTAVVPAGVHALRGVREAKELFVPAGAPA
ncbi:MAG: adenylate/guanylate cyclase domain-containing protein [Alphaproteobacteria bacterium]